MALALGQANPYEMMSAIPWRVYQDWQRFYQVEPFGDEANGLRLAFGLANIGNLLGKPKGKKSWKVDDFRARFKKPGQSKSSPEEQLSKVMLANQMMGGKFVDKRGQRGKSD